MTKRTGCCSQGSKRQFKSLGFHVVMLRDTQEHGWQLCRCVWHSYCCCCCFLGFFACAFVSYPSADPDVVFDLFSSGARLATLLMRMAFVSASDAYVCEHVLLLIMILCLLVCAGAQSLCWHPWFIVSLLPPAMWKTVSFSKLFQQSKSLICLLLQERGWPLC